MRQDEEIERLREKVETLKRMNRELGWQLWLLRPPGKDAELDALLRQNMIQCRSDID